MQGPAKTGVRVSVYVCDNGIFANLIVFWLPCTGSWMHDSFFMCEVTKFSYFSGGQAFLSTIHFSLRFAG